MLLINITHYLNVQYNYTVTRTIPTTTLQCKYTFKYRVLINYTHLL